jgi:hypothetical protein
MDSEMYLVDRRQIERFKVPRMWIKYLYKESKNVSRIVNFSRSSVCFESKQPLEIESLINLSVIYNKKNIKLKGNVIRTSNSNLGDYPYHVVIQFLAFGSDKRYNSMDSYTQLKKLEQEYLENILEVI